MHRRERKKSGKNEGSASPSRGKAARGKDGGGSDSARARRSKPPPVAGRRLALHPEPMIGAWGRQGSNQRLPVARPVSSCYAGRRRHAAERYVRGASTNENAIPGEKGARRQCAQPAVGTGVVRRRGPPRSPEAHSPHRRSERLMRVRGALSSAQRATGSGEVDVISGGPATAVRAQSRVLRFLRARAPSGCTGTGPWRLLQRVDEPRTAAHHAKKYREKLQTRGGVEEK